jgi:hypothetical protein
MSFGEYLGSPGLHFYASGRMPLATSVCVLLLVLASATPGRPRVSQLAALGSGAIAGLVLVGFSFGTRTLARFSDTSMSVPAALAVVLLALASLARTRDGWLHWVLRGSDAGAMALRRTLPAVVLGLPALSFLHMQGESRFWKDERVAEAGFVTLLIGLVSALLFWVASSLRVLDLQREQARQDLLAVNARLATDIHSTFASLHAARQRIGSLEDSQRAVLTVHDNVLQTIFASGLMIKSKLDTASGDAGADESVQRTLDSMDDAVRAIRCVVEDLNDQLGPRPGS